MRLVDLTKLDFSGDQVLTLLLDGVHAEDVEDLTDEFLNWFDLQETKPSAHTLINHNKMNVPILVSSIVITISVEVSEYLFEWGK